MPLVQAKSVVDGSAVNVIDVLKSENEIPAYQRDYVWQKKQIVQLWEDLIEHFKRYNHNEELIDPEGYFIGAIVVIAKDATEPLEIVDGQQRLTALSTIAATLYTAIEKWPTNYPAKIGFEQRLREMLGRYDSDWKTNLRFPDSNLQEFFLQSCLLKRSEADRLQYWESPECTAMLARKRSPQARIREAMETGSNLLGTFLREQPDIALAHKRLESFVKLVTEGIIFLRIQAMSYPNAYVIFESLNNRGIALSQADLIKNELLKKSASADRENIADTWLSVRQTVDNVELISFPDFIHYSFLSRHGSVKAKDLYNKIKTQLNSRGAAKTYVKELEEDATALEAVINNFNSSWTTESTDMLKDIQSVLNIHLCYPFLLSTYRSYKNDKRKFESHVKLIMNFAFRFMKVMDGSVESFAGAISTGCELVNAKQPISKISSHFKAHAPDAAFVADFKGSSFNNTKLAYFTVYYLEKVQLGGTAPLPHGQDQHLEHIMPKSPKAKHWPEASAEKIASSDNYKHHLWRIGNLLPLPADVNKVIQNREIAYKLKNAKLKDYTSGKHSLISPTKVGNFLNNGKWNFTSIEDRQAWLANNFAVKAWPL
jgi:hypothetical protein